MKKYLLTLMAALTLSFGESSLSAQTTPPTVLHAVTVAWKTEAKPEQIQAALDGAKALPAQYPGIRRVWTRTLKAQDGKTNVIAMEFADEAALKAYADSPAQKEWYKTYLPLREKSASFDAGGADVAVTLGNSPTAETAPTSVIHVVTVAWKAGTKPEQIQAALDGAQALPAQYPGIKRVWPKTLKAQADKANVIVMEFADEAALKAYTDSPAQKEWYKTYLPIREKSASFDVTN